MAVWGPTGIAADGDDGQWDGSSWTNKTSSYSTGEFFQVKRAGTSVHGALRFLNATIPAGATINSATLTLQRYAAAVSVNPTTSVLTVFADVGSSRTAALDSAHNPGTAWTNSTANTQKTGVDADPLTIDVASIIQELVNLGGWASGDNICLKLDPVANSGDTYWITYWVDYDADTLADVATLVVDYTAAGGGGATATPGVGAVSVAGQIPSLLKDLPLSPTQGLVSVAGQAPTLYLERTIVPTQGLSTVVEQLASTVGVLALDSAVGLVTAQGLAPALSLEQSVTPAAGLVIVEGRAPELLGDGVVLGTAEPITGAVSVQGLVPSFITETLDETRGHARRRRAARRTRIVEEPSSGPVQAIVLAPDVPAYFDPPTNRLAGFNTLADALEVRLTEIEHKRAAIARRRREEEEIVRFLLRVA